MSHSPVFWNVLCNLEHTVHGGLYVLVRPLSERVSARYLNLTVFFFLPVFCLGAGFFLGQFNKSFILLINWKESLDT